MHLAYATVCDSLLEPKPHQIPQTPICSPISPQSRFPSLARQICEGICRFEASLHLRRKVEGKHMEICV